MPWRGLTEQREERLSLLRLSRVVTEGYKSQNALLRMLWACQWQGGYLRRSHPSYPLTQALLLYCMGVRPLYTVCLLKKTLQRYNIFPVFEWLQLSFLLLLSGKTLRWETIGLPDIRCCNRIIHGQEHIQELSLEEAVGKSPLIYNSQFCYPV